MRETCFVSMEQRSSAPDYIPDKGSENRNVYKVCNVYGKCLYDELIFACEDLNPSSSTNQLFLQELCEFFKVAVQCFSWNTLRNAKKEPLMDRLI